MSEEKIIHLDIALDYPVDWMFDKILRDLIQNFYDALGYGNFFHGFQSDYDAGTETLTMQSEIPFSINWLKFIGASGKRGNGDSVGMYGEGFKIAALAAYRDFHWNITMESSDWRICVTEATVPVADQELAP